MVYFRSLRAIALACALCIAPAAAQAESLREALTQAYLNNPTIMSALLSVYSAAENIVLAKSAKLPTVSGSATTNLGSFQVSGGAFTTGDPSFSLGLTYAQNLYDGGASDADIEAARALTELSRYTLQNSEQNVLLAVVQAYMGVIRDTQLVQLRQENVKFYQAQVDSANERLKIGEGTKIDVSQAEARLAQATASYQSAIASLQTSRASYERYVGHKPSNLNNGFDVAKMLPRNLEAAIAEAVASHPAIRSAKAGIRAAQASSESAEAAFGPTLDLIGSLCAIDCIQGGGQGVTGSLRLSLSVPIYSGGRNGANFRKANIAQIKSEVDALAARDQIKEAVISAWSQMQSAAATITSAETAVSAGELSLNGVIEQRDVGQLTTLDVLNAQSELSSVRE
ncbi:MAG: TolC family outer membrane protein, partial [Devosia sp.]